MTNEYRKIELQAPADVLFLRNNSVALSQKKLDLHFPLSAAAAGEPRHPDVMRDRVHDIVLEFINETFRTAISSISINGLDADRTLVSTEATPGPTTAHVEFEPFDSKLSSQVSALHAQLEALTTSVAQLRRDTPTTAANIYAVALAKALVDDDLDEELSPPISDEETGFDIPESWQGAETTYEYGLRTLVTLQGKSLDMTRGRQSKGVTETMGKADRARKAIDMVERLC